MVGWGCFGYGYDVVGLKIIRGVFGVFGVGEVWCGSLEIPPGYF